MDDLKRLLTIDIVQKCTSWTTPEQRMLIESAVTLALSNYTVSKEETALSTEFAESNDKYIKRFLAIKMVKGLSERTIDYYGRQLNSIFQQIEKPIPAITTNDIRTYMAKRKLQARVTNVTIDNELRIMRSFFQTMAAEELIRRDPTIPIEHVKCEKQVKEPFTEMDIEKIRNAAAQRAGKGGWNYPLLVQRDIALVEVLLSTGCRASEICGMQRDQLKGDSIKVLGKGNKERIVYLNAKAQLALENYLKLRTDNIKWIFPKFEPDVIKKIVTAIDKQADANTIGGIVEKIGKRAGVENCHPHRFRRTAATFALRRGMPIEQVGKMLGHEQLTTTQIYAKVLDDDVRRSHEKYLT